MLAMVFLPLIAGELDGFSKGTQWSWDESQLTLPPINSGPSSVISAVSGVIMMQTASDTTETEYPEAPWRKNKRKKSETNPDDENDEFGDHPEAVQERAAARARLQQKKEQKRQEALQDAKKKEQESEKELAKQKVLANAAKARTRPSWLSPEDWERARRAYHTIGGASSSSSQVHSQVPYTMPKSAGHETGNPGLAEIPEADESCPAIASYIEEIGLNLESSSGSVQPSPEPVDSVQSVDTHSTEWTPGALTSDDHADVDRCLGSNPEIPVDQPNEGRTDNTVPSASTDRTGDENTKDVSSPSAQRIFAQHIADNSETVEETLAANYRTEADSSEGLPPAATTPTGQTSFTLAAAIQANEELIQSLQAEVSGLEARIARPTRAHESSYLPPTPKYSGTRLGIPPAYHSSSHGGDSIYGLIRGQLTGVLPQAPPQGAQYLYQGLIRGRLTSASSVSNPVNEPTVPDVPMVHKSYQAEPGRDMQEMPPTTPTLHLEEVLVHHDHVIVDSTGSVEGQNTHDNEILPMTEQVGPVSTQVSTQVSAPETVPVQENVPAQETVSSDMQEVPPTTPTLHLDEGLVHHDHVIIDSTGSVEGQNIQVNDILPMTEQVRPVSTQASAPEPVPVQEMIPAQETVSSDSDISLLQSFLNIGRQLHNAL